MKDCEELTPMQDLILHVMYEFQHKAGNRGLTEAEIGMHVADAIFDFGDEIKAVAGIRERCGLPQGNG